MQNENIENIEKNENIEKLPNPNENPIRKLGTCFDIYILIKILTLICKIKKLVYNFGLRYKVKNTGKKGKLFQQLA